jgi:ABC-type hemin transport system substrate-binding protein
MRIVSLLASATEVVCALGAREMLVGRSHECDNPEWVRRLGGTALPCSLAAQQAVNDLCSTYKDYQACLAGHE